MPLCPGCKTEQTKRVGGKCPTCKIEIDIYKGQWFQSGAGSPPKTLLRHFEDLVSVSLSKQRSTQVNFSIPMKGLGYKRELAAAGELIALADFDLGLAKDTLSFMFTDKKYNWKNRSTMLWLKKDFIEVLAVVKALREDANKAMEREAEAAARAMAREDVFS